MLKAIRSCLSFALCLAAPVAAQAQALHRLDVDVFNSGTVWPIWVAQDKGFFASNGLDVHLIPTPGSLAQMEGLIDGKFDIAMTAIDNLIAYMEGEGEAKTESVPNIVAVMGSDNGFLSLVTAPAASSFADLRGATLSVDALTTGYAFVLEEMLKLRGLNSGDYTLVKAGGFQQRFDGLVAGTQAGTLSVPPFTFLATGKGFHDLGSAVSVLGHYQGVVAAVRKDWAPGHRDELVGYIRSYIARCDLALRPGQPGGGAGHLRQAPAGRHPGHRRQVLRRVPGPADRLRPPCRHRCRRRGEGNPDPPGLCHAAQGAERADALLRS